MPTTVGFGWRDSLNTVNTDFRRKQLPNAVGANDGNNVAVVRRKEVHIAAVCIQEFCDCSEQIRCEKFRVVSAFTRFNFEYGLATPTKLLFKSLETRCRQATAS